MEKWRGKLTPRPPDQPIAAASITGQTRVALVPDAQTWHLAGVIAGTLARVQGFQPHQRKECLNDALIYLTAAKQGLPVVTANRVEFDMIQQIAPGGTFLHF